MFNCNGLVDSPGSENAILLGVFTIFKFYHTQLIKNYSRTYVKLQTVLANIGGALNGVLTLAIILNFNFFSKIYYQFVGSRKIFNDKYVKNIASEFNINITT